MITETLLVQSQTCTPLMAEKWCIPLRYTCSNFDINTPERVAGFLAQVGHESGGLRFTTEDLHYRAETLTRIWSKRFPPGVAESYAMQPERIANRAYADRMGNGDEASGEGWLYRGRGLIQLTGKDAYAAFSLAANNEALVKPDLVAEPELAALSAGWFWVDKGLNALADQKDIVGMTLRVNGGTNGLDDRQMRYSRLISCLNAG
jgi:putative chitinase